MSLANVWQEVDARAQAALVAAGWTLHNLEGGSLWASRGDHGFIRPDLRRLVAAIERVDAQHNGPDAEFCGICGESLCDDCAGDVGFRDRWWDGRAHEMCALYDAAEDV